MQNDADESAPVIVNRICFLLEKVTFWFSSMQFILCVKPSFSLSLFWKAAKKRFLGGAFLSSFTFLVGDLCHFVMFPATIPATFALVS